VRALRGMLCRLLLTDNAHSSSIHHHHTTTSTPPDYYFFFNTLNPIHRPTPTPPHPTTTPPHPLIIDMMLDDLNKAPELRFDQLQISDPRLYFEGAHATTTSAAASAAAGGAAGGGVAAGGGPAGRAGAKRSAVEQLGRLDPMQLADPPEDPAVAQDVSALLGGGVGCLGGAWGWGVILQSCCFKAPLLSAETSPQIT